jgi:hypothetical protein
MPREPYCFSRAVALLGNIDLGYIFTLPVFIGLGAIVIVTLDIPGVAIKE